MSDDIILNANLLFLYKIILYNYSVQNICHSFLSAMKSLFLLP